MSVRIVRFLLWLYLLSEAQTNLVISGIVQDQSGAPFLKPKSMSCRTARNGLETIAQIYQEAITWSLRSLNAFSATR